MDQRHPSRHTGQTYGFAWPSWLNTEPTTQTRPSGGGEGDEICYEYFEWWFDEWGDYHETILDTWCEEFET